MRKYGSGPARAQPIGLGHASIRLPERILENVGDDNRLSAVDGRAARSRLRSDAKAVDGLGVGLGKTGCGAVPHMLPVLVKEQYRAKQPANWASTTRTRFSSISSSGASRAIISKIRLSPSRRASARLRSVISVTAPTNSKLPDSPFVEG